MREKRFVRAVVRTPGPDAGKGLTASGLGPPDIPHLLEQHAAYVAALRSCGLEVVVLETAAGFPDAYFIEDTAVVTQEVAVIAIPGAPSRRGEAALVEPVLARFRPTVRIEPPGTLDGGDVLDAGSRIFIGLSDRTNAEGAAQLAGILSARGHECVTVPLAGGLHLKSSVNAAGDDVLIVTAAFAGEAAFRGFRKIVLPPPEEYAANLLGINGRLLVPAGYPGARAKLAALGLPILELETSEFRKMDGGLTCLSLRL